MDAFAISICKGLAVRKATLKHCCLAGLYFGGFQAGMPLLGFILGVQFKEYITRIDHWVVFFMLSLIGINMIRESFKKEECDCEITPVSEVNPFEYKAMLLLATATSIDALAVGITFAFLEVNIIWAVIFIGIITFLFSVAGIKIGNVFGDKYKSKAELSGGIILLCMGIKIVLDHTGIL